VHLARKRIQNHSVEKLHVVDRVKWRGEKLTQTQVDGQQQLLATTCCNILWTLKTAIYCSTTVLESVLVINFKVITAQ